MSNTFSAVGELVPNYLINVHISSFFASWPRTASLFAASTIHIGVIFKRFFFQNIFAISIISSESEKIACVQGRFQITPRLTLG
jgi:hypothetical protein